MSSTKEGRVGQVAQIGIDVADLDRSAEFWMGVLGLKIAGRNDVYLHFERQGDGPALYLQRVPEKKSSKARLHLDIGVKDVDAAIARVEALGARKLEEVEESGSRWIVMADPDGNEFCLVQG